MKIPLIFLTKMRRSTNEGSQWCQAMGWDIARRTQSIGGKSFFLYKSGRSYS